MSAETSEPAVFELLTRHDCHLCGVMEEALRAVLPRRHMSYTKVDVDLDPALRQRYGDTVPVLLYHGEEVARVRISPRRLAAMLDRMI